MRRLLAFPVNHQAFTGKIRFVRARPAGGYLQRSDELLLSAFSQPRWVGDSGHRSAPWLVCHDGSPVAAVARLRASAAQSAASRKPIEEKEEGGSQPRKRAIKSAPLTMSLRTLHVGPPSGTCRQRGRVLQELGHQVEFVRSGDPDEFWGRQRWRIARRLTQRYPDTHMAAARYSKPVVAEEST